MFPVINQFGTIIFTRTTQQEAIRDAITLARNNNLKYYVCKPFIEITPPSSEVTIKYMEAQ